MKKMNKKGFTLVELMVVLAILGLLAGIGVPQYMQTLNRARIAADGALVSTVQSAVRVFMSETASTATSLQTSSVAPIDKTLKTGHQADSILTGESLTLSTFLPGGVLPVGDAFESLSGVVAGDWKINDAGEVYVEKGTTRIPADITP